MALRTLDLSLFTHGSGYDRQHFGSQLLRSLSQDGFVKLIGHGITDSAVYKLFEWNRSFFQMRAEDKSSIAHPGGPEPQRGWSSVGAESSSSLYRKGSLKSKVTKDLRDAREHFDQGSRSDTEYPTRWPDEGVLPGFRGFMEDAFETMEGVATQIMAALELACELPPGTFLEKTTHRYNASEMRLNHYPPIESAEIESGTDTVGGLEFENRKQLDTFERVECGYPTEMIVNVSETLQRWTNGTLPAGLHRVNLPKDLAGNDGGVLPERYSIAYFCKADRSASVGPLEQFVRDGSDPKYEDISAIEYHQRRLQSAY